MWLTLYSYFFFLCITGFSLVIIYAIPLHDIHDPVEYDHLVLDSVNPVYDDSRTIIQLFNMSNNIEELLERKNVQADSLSKQNSPSQPVPLNGVLLIPGIAGSGLFVSLNNASLPDCSDVSLTIPRSRLWASILQALPPASHQQCWVQKMLLQWGIPEKCRSAVQSFSRWRFGSILFHLVASWWPVWPFNGGSPLDSLVSDCEPRYFPVPGVQVDVDSPGKTHGFDFLDYFEGIGISATKYFHDIIIMLKQTGYVEGDTLLGHPFDWRYPLWQLDYTGLKAIIEDFVQRHPDKKLVIIAHSLGAAMTNFFLTRFVTSDWKAKHIESFVPIAGAFGGSHKAIRSVLSGYSDATQVDFFGVFNISIIPPLLLRRAHRSFGSMYSMTPNLQLFGKDTAVIKIIKRQTVLNNSLNATRARIVNAPKQNLTLYEIERITESDPDLATRSSIGEAHGNISNKVSKLQHQLLPSSVDILKSPFVDPERRISGTPPSLEPAVYTLTDWWKLLPEELQGKAQQAQQKVSTDKAVLEDPQVPVYCLWSVFDFPSTEVEYEYDAENVDIAPRMKLGLGDTTIPMESASYCKKWTSTVLSKEFKNLDHMAILMNHEFVRFVVSLVSGNPVALITSTSDVVKLQFSGKNIYS